ncbi:ead/Ea22-like family protein [Enterobacter hormaechei]|uniref:ead/Ea22-like family protein n=1 Tax=Enterobacter hormaechei TaxID=158836 RepID=UPI0006987CEA|nr:ead/Ea22-like family protein [Enterobacter hormaechei]
MSNIDKLKPGKYAILFRNNWDGEGDTYETFAILDAEGIWRDEDGDELLEYQGGEVLKAWPLDDGSDVLALLDELEAKDNRINRLEAIVAVAEQRNAMMREWKRALKVPCDLVDDQVPVVIHGMVIRLERFKETEEKLTAAERRIAELSHHLQCAHGFIEHTEAFGHEASNGILCCGDAQWDIDASKSDLAAAAKGE